ncbi:unnamed protein product [Darwinula stevensoni]|uniref:Uncharacterized protein n=1 Tax=Darwinula stevensoni TaxID=69355 RepID=A0A7R8X709_9CRUS|nr:unnamed protein product [Darwinula stevensoni]CAG0886480.1 unnamed protein product [Darwinula stevensoni]
MLTFWSEVPWLRSPSYQHMQKVHRADGGSDDVLPFFLPCLSPKPQFLLNHQRMRTLFGAQPTMTGFSKANYFTLRLRLLHSETHVQVPNESMSHVIEDSDGGSSDGSKPRGRFFGVRNYIHQFYEGLSSSKEEERSALIKSRHLRRRRCRSFTFKVLLGVGSICLVLGLILLLLGHLIVPREVLLTKYNMDIVDHAAERFNQNLEICKKTGLVFFCCGGLALVVTLLCPSFLRNEDSVQFDPFVIQIGDCTDEEDVKSPIEKIPVTQEVTPIQPHSDLP